MPSMPGILMSVTTMSARCASKAAMPSAPLRAQATAYPSVSRERLSTLRISGSSSMSRIRVMLKP